MVSAESQTFSGESRRIRSVIPCGHEFCEHCLRSHCISVISTKTAQLLCPEIDCNESIPEVLERSLLSEFAPLEWQKLRQLKKLEKQPSLLECPYCNDLTTGQDEENDIICTVCRKRFCRVHGAMHPETTCDEFKESSQGRAHNLTEEALDKHTKKCSRCGARLQRSNGCDYVVCGNCHGDFCYKCETHEHIETDESGRRRQCKKCDSVPHNTSPSQSPCEITCICILYIIVTIAWPVLALVGLLLTGCLGCCFWGCRMERGKPRQPGRAAFAIVIIECMPIMFCLDAMYARWKKRPEGFIAQTLPPDWSGYTDEIPFATVGEAVSTMDTAVSHNEDVNGDEEQGLQSPASANN